MFFKELLITMCCIFTTVLFNDVATKQQTIRTLGDIVLTKTEV